MVDLRELVIKFSLDKRPPLSLMKQKQNVAWNRVNRAIKKGKIKRPTICHMCFIKCTPEAHHQNYDKWNLLQWVCRSCHLELSLNESHKNL